MSVSPATGAQWTVEFQVAKYVIVPMPPGTYVTHYDRETLFDGARDEDAMLLIVGEGSATATPAAAK
jgi:hypothetical protein